jgi:hypothetical protein
MAPATNRGRRIAGHDLPEHQPVEEHFESSEVLFHAGPGNLTPELLDVSGDMQRLAVWLICQAENSLSHCPRIWFLEFLPAYGHNTWRQPLPTSSANAKNSLSGLARLQTTSTDVREIESSFDALGDESDAGQEPW